MEAGHFQVHFSRVRFKTSKNRHRQKLKKLCIRDLLRHGRANARKIQQPVLFACRQRTDRHSEAQGGLGSGAKDRRTLSRKDLRDSLRAGVGDRLRSCPPLYRYPSPSGGF